MKKIAVDLDGTLAYYVSGQYPEIGEPIDVMYARVNEWLEEGHEVVIFTARASNGRKDIDQVKHWLKKYGLDELEVSCIKTTDIDEFWDDKAVQVIPNTGECIGNEKVQESAACRLDMKSAKPLTLIQELEKDKP